MASFLIRVRLPDRPGALGAVASRIGAVGGDVVSMEILERGTGTVVDELGVELASPDVVDLLQSEILEVDGVGIELVRPLSDPLPDHHAELLDIAIRLVAVPTGPAVLEELASGACRSLSADYAVVVARPVAEHTVLAAAGAVPPAGVPWPVVDAVAAGQASAGQAGRRPDSVSVPCGTMAAAELDRAGAFLVACRPEAPFRARERARLLGMAMLADRCWDGLASGR